jgi:putative transcriptional regulator
MAKSHKSLKGRLLLDGGKLQGSSFHRTVVLICQHDAEGALGLVLNRPTGSKVGGALPGQLSDGLKDQMLYAGGPVQPQALSYLWSDPVMPEANVIPNLSLGHSLEQLLEISGDGSLTRKVSVFAGYAGWSAGQLDEEMERESWITHTASLDWVFYPHPDQLWRKIILRKGWRYRLVAEGPDDLSSN